MKVLQLLKKPFFVYGFAGLTASISAYVGWSLGKPVYLEYQDSFAAKEFREYGVMGTYQKHFFAFAGRLHGLAGLEHENEELQNQVAQLEKKTAQTDNAQAERDLASLNEHLEMKLKSETGSAEARIPQSLTYQVPEHLNHNQLYTLALGYFRKQEFEKSAVIFSFLLSLADDHSYERAENYLLNAISWAKLKDYQRASKLVAEAQKHSLKADPVHRQAILWQAMIEKSLGKEKLAQSTLLNFIGQYPHSEEGQLINAARKPARSEAHEVIEQKANPFEAVIADAKARAKSASEVKKDFKEVEVKEQGNHENEAQAGE